jgi:hypothetical protein
LVIFKRYAGVTPAEYRSRIAQMGFDRGELFLAALLHNPPRSYRAIGDQDHSHSQTETPRFFRLIHPLETVCTVRTVCVGQRSHG